MSERELETRLQEAHAVADAAHRELAAERESRAGLRMDELLTELEGYRMERDSYARDLMAARRALVEQAEAHARTLALLLRQT